MEAFVDWIAFMLGYIIRPCYAVTGNYALTILLFTFVSKIILSPVSIWVHKNSIKAVSMQPDINRIRVCHWGDQDTIAEEQAKVYKKNHYNAFASLLPILIQMLILIGLVEVIYNPLRYLMRLPDDFIIELENLTHLLTNCDITDSVIQLKAISTIQEGLYSDSFAVLSTRFPLIDTNAILSSIKLLDMDCLGLSLASIPFTVSGKYYAFPIVAAFSSWLLCYTQNHSQVLQSEQGKLNKYGVMSFSVLLSTYLGLFVPAGIALYWLFSNLMSIVQTYILNLFIDPKKSIDYEALRDSRKKLDEITNFGKDGEKRVLFKHDPNSKRERKDYARFFSIVNKHIVFYSEKSGFWKYYDDIILELLKRTNLRIHYVTNDPNDKVFELAQKESRLLPYYISPQKTVSLMMRMDASMVVMTTPDLDSYQIKRSYVKKDIEYVFTPHDALSVHMGFREGALDHFDTVFCAGPQQIKEIRATEKLYNTREKTLLPCGYCLLDDLLRSYTQSPCAKNGKILIAPSWQEDNILDSCIDKLIESLIPEQYDIIVRPHPEYVKRYPNRMNELIEKYSSPSYKTLRFEMDFSSNESIWSCDLLITDWSGIGYEYSYTTERPTLFINTKMKTMNANWENIGIVPLEISLRDKIGVSIEKHELDRIPTIVSDMLRTGEEWIDQIRKVRDENVFNIGRCGVVAADYIIKRMAERSAVDVHKQV